MTSKQTALPCISTKYLRYEVFSFSCALSRKWNESKFPERINMLKSRMIGEISHSPALNHRWQRWERRLCGMCCYSQQGFAFTKPLFFQFTSFSKLITDLSIKKSVPSIKIKKKQKKQNKIVPICIALAHISWRLLHFTEHIITVCEIYVIDDAYGYLYNL